MRSMIVTKELTTQPKIAETEQLQLDSTKHWKDDYSRKTKVIDFLTKPKRD